MAVQNALAATSQINVRLPRSVKEAGDAALRRAGVSPSEIVRELWGILALPGTSVEQVRQSLAAQDETDAKLAERLEVAKTLGQPLEDLCERYGVPLVPSDLEDNWREVATEARIERLRERGLHD